jgi:hypothetical protein
VIGPEWLQSKERVSATDQLIPGQDPNLVSHQSGAAERGLRWSKVMEVEEYLRVLDLQLAAVHRLHCPKLERKP